MSVRKFLLVDDDPGVTFLNRYLLENSGVDCEIYTAENGQDALEELEKMQQCPDVIVLDVNMPVMDGFEFLEAFKNRSSCYNSTAVYILTSSLRDEDREKAASFACVKKYLEKPLDGDLVKEVLGI